MTKILKQASLKPGETIYFYRNQSIHTGIYLTSVWQEINQFEKEKFYLVFPTSYTTKQNETITVEPRLCSIQCSIHYKYFTRRYKKFLREDKEIIKSTIAHYQSKLNDIEFLLR